MRMHDGAPVEPGVAGCCVGMAGVGSSGYALCASDVTVGGRLVFTDPPEVLRAFTCDRHEVVLSDPRPLTADDIDELDRRLRSGST